MGEDVYDVFAKDMPSSSGRRGVLTKQGIYHALATKEIRYLNRNGPNNSDTGTSTPGEYYIAVSLTRKDNDKPFTIPMTLTVGLQGTAGTGKPEYVGGATPVAGDSVTPTPTNAPSQPSDEKTEAGGPVQDNGGNSSDSSTPVGLIAGLGGGALLLVLVGAWAVLRLRTKPAAVGGPPQNTWQPPTSYPNQQPPTGPTNLGPGDPRQGPGRPPR
jgi:Ca-activated chloride channel family protein